MARLTAEERQAKKAAYKEQRRFNRLNKKARVGTQLPEKQDGWCFRKARTLMLVSTVGFVIIGIILFAMGIYGINNKWADMIGKGPGVSVCIFGVIVILVAFMGWFGYKRDAKCWLLLYFVLLSVALLTLVIMGGVILFQNSSINDTFSRWWCEYPDVAVEGQLDFDCCGYECPVDRPAEGSCGDLYDLTGQTILTCASGDDPDPGKAQCAAAMLTNPPPGCKDRGVDFLKERFIPLFALAFSFGILLLVGLSVSFYLLCHRYEGKDARMEANPDAVNYNSVDVSHMAPPQQPVTGAGTSAV